MQVTILDPSAINARLGLKAKTHSDISVVVIKDIMKYLCPCLTQLKCCVLFWFVS